MKQDHQHIQSAQRNCAWYKNEIKRLAAAIAHDAMAYRKTVADFKSSGAWKEEFKTWAHASKAVLDITPQRSNELIRELNEHYEEESETPLSISDRLPPAEHIEEEEDLSVIESFGKPSEPAPIPPKPVLDTTDHEIPSNLLPTWERRDEVQELMTLASKLRCAIENIKNKRDPLFLGGFTCELHVTNLTAIHYQLSMCKPGVVCPDCNGTLRDDHDKECRKCRLTGFISEREFTTYKNSSSSENKAKLNARNGHGGARLPI